MLKNTFEKSLKRGRAKDNKYLFSVQGSKFYFRGEFIEIPKLAELEDSQRSIFLPQKERLPQEVCTDLTVPLSQTGLKVQKDHIDDKDCRKFNDLLP